MSVFGSAPVLSRLSRSSFPTTDPSCSSFPTTKYLLCVSSMRTGSKHLHSLVNGGVLLPVATERRCNAPKRGGAAGPKVDSRKAGICRVIRGGICHGCGALRVIPLQLLGTNKQVGKFYLAIVGILLSGCAATRKRDIFPWKGEVLLFDIIIYTTGFTGIIHFVCSPVGFADGIAHQDQDLVHAEELTRWNDSPGPTEAPPAIQAAYLVCL